MIEYKEKYKRGIDHVVVGINKKGDIFSWAMASFPEAGETGREVPCEMERSPPMPQRKHIDDVI